MAKIKAGLDPGVEVELWWQDEARVGQKNKITRRWARRGARPSAPKDQRTKWAYIFGAICPAKGKGAGLVMPYCDTDAMNQHLALISAEVARDAHAVLLVDQAGLRLPGGEDGREQCTTAVAIECRKLEKTRLCGIDAQL